jgi:hypothetical protein
MTTDPRMLGEPRRYVERIEALEAQNAYLRKRAEGLHSSDPCEVLEVAMQCHLPVRLPDATVMCLCHGDDDDHYRVTTALFDGPVFHRQHVAAIQWAALRAAGHVQ